MAFTIDANAEHRPLGFTLDGRIVVDRHAPDRPGAAAAALLPPDAIADAEGRALRAELRRSGGVLTATTRSPSLTAVVASARGVVEGHGTSVVGFAECRPVPPERTPLRAWLLTDARLAPSTLEALLQELASRSFATLAGVATPDPGDAIVALANGAVGDAEIAPGSIGWQTLLVGSVAVAQTLVRRLLEEAFAPHPARVVQITASGALDEREAAQVVEALAADAGARAAMAAAGPDRATCAAVVARVTARGDAVRSSCHSNWSARAARAESSRAGHTEQAALRIDLGAGRAMATRWTAVATT